MARKPKPGPVWTTAGDRVTWLMHDGYGGSRSKLAAAAQTKVTNVNKVVTGQQQPGRLLLEAIAQHTDANPAWLLLGVGPPYRTSHLPTAHTPLAGPPAKHADLLATEGADDLKDLYSPSRYWLAVRPDDPVVGHGRLAVRPGDLFLVETAPDEFPPDDKLTDRLAAVQVPGRKDAAPKLAELEHHPADDDGPSHIVAHVFTSAVQTIERIYVDLPQHGEPVVRRRRVWVPRPGQAGSDAIPARSVLGQPAPEIVVSRNDIVGVVLLLLRRPSAAS